MLITTTTLLIAVITIGAGILSGMIAYLVYTMFFKKESEEELYRKQMNALLEDDEAEYYNKSIVKQRKDFIQKWYEFWNETLELKFPERYNEDLGNNNPKKAGNEILIAMLIIALIVYLIVRNPLIAIGASTGLSIVFAFVLRQERKKRQDRISNQIVAFLYALKANIQAGETPESALVKVIDNVPSPLGEELTPIKHQILSNTPFKEALKDLRGRTNSSDLKTLCSYMIQSSLSGSSIESQIDTIIETVESKKEISDKIKEETKSMESQKIIASAIIPVMFIVMYVLTPSSRSFWFIDPLSWPILTVIIILCLISFYHSKRRIDSVKALTEG